MALDRKYGHVTLERGTIGEDEPVFVIRGQDTLATLLLAKYRTMCGEAGSPAAHLYGITQAIDDFAAWQHDRQLKIPGSVPPV